ncbi:MAG: flagellar basal body P-ring protein FlgI [bacterium]|nr:flagellar basal body P-ring protein FlgI [bacterium]
MMRTMQGMRSILVRMAAALTAVALAACVALPARAQSVRIKDVAKVQGVATNQLVGYGLVTGLAGTGDSTSVVFTSKTIQNLLQSFGLSTSSQDVRTRNVAAVVVTASLPPFAHSGDTVDVTVSTLGDATSLQGGTLILTSLRGADNQVYATAQGAVSIGGYTASNASAGANSVTENHPSAGRVPGGGLIARTVTTPLQQDNGSFNYVLLQPDFNTAANLARALNQRFGASTAHADDEGTVRVQLPLSYRSDEVDFLAQAGDIDIHAGEIAKVVLNERTGTVVMGGDITLAPVAIAHGNLSITITTTNTAVPSGPFTTAPGQTQTNTRISVNEQKNKLVYFQGEPTLARVVRALNTLGVSPRDLIAILQALHASGALQADIEII